MPTNEPQTVNCSTCHGDGVVEFLKPSSRYADSPDYVERECEDCGGTGSDACEWCGEPALAECSDMSISAKGPGATVCSWTCKALMLDGFAAVAKAVDDQRRILEIGKRHDAASYLAAVVQR